MHKELGIIGLGRMGGNVARRLAKAGWHVVGYNRSPDDTKALEKEPLFKGKGIDGAYSIQELVNKLSKPRVVLTILTAGKPTDEVLDNLVKNLEADDIIIEGANSFYEDTVRRSKKVIKQGVKFIDVGVSGGPGGALTGACLMIGGSKQLFKYLEPLFIAMAAPKAYQHFEGVGAGHFVKMVHNGIEYGMMQSIAEGFNLLKNGPYKVNVIDAATIYQNKSVVTSRLVDWLLEGFKKFGMDLNDVSGSVGYTGEAQYTYKTGKKLGLPMKIILGSILFRKASQTNPSYIGKVLTTMRNGFGQHSIESGKMT